MNQFVEIFSLYSSKIGQWINWDFLIHISKKYVGAIATRLVTETSTNYSKLSVKIDSIGQSVIIRLWPIGIIMAPESISLGLKSSHIKK